MVIPPRSSKLVHGVVHTGGDGGRQVQGLFIPDSHLLMEGPLEMSETLVTLDRGSSCTVGILVQNDTGSSITLKKKYGSRAHSASKVHNPPETSQE